MRGFQERIFPLAAMGGGLTIHGARFIPTRGVLKKHLLGHAWSGRLSAAQGMPARIGMGAAKSRTPSPQASGPHLSGDLSVPGFWKGDLIEEPGHSCLATLVYRHCRHVMLCKIDNRHTESVVSHLAKKTRRLFRELYASLIRDRGADLDEQRMAQP